MKKDKENLFLILLKLKSYLVSMIDEPADNYSNLKLAEEYLELKFPEKKNKIIRLLEDNNIYSDSEIAFDEKIITKFRTIAHEHKTNSSGDPALADSGGVCGGNGLGRGGGGL